MGQNSVLSFSDADFQTSVEVYSEILVSFVGAEVTALRSMRDAVGRDDVSMVLAAVVTNSDVMRSTKSGDST